MRIYDSDFVVVWNDPKIKIVEHAVPDMYVASGASATGDLTDKSLVGTKQCAQPSLAVVLQK